MEINPVILTLLNHRSVRKYKPDQPSDEIVETIVRAGQQAPFASQLYSVLLSRKRKGPFGAPLHFILCVDIYKLERFMQQRGWELRTNHLLLLMFGIQDAAYMAENMVVAAESLGLGTCFLGGAPHMADKIAKQFNLPLRVFPLVGLVMGYPDEDFPPRPRYPLTFTLFEDTYPELSDAQVNEAMQVMDEGYLQQDYYRKQHAKIGWKWSERKPSLTGITPGPSTSRANGGSGGPRPRNCWSSCTCAGLTSPEIRKKRRVKNELWSAQ